MILLLDEVASTSANDRNIKSDMYKDMCTVSFETVFDLETVHSHASDGEDVIWRKWSSMLRKMPLN